MDALLHGTQYRKDHELCHGIRVIIGSEGGWQGNQIYQLPKKTILEKLEIWATTRYLKTTYSTASLYIKPVMTAN
jgi:16S rRNA U1498 N3-methylase RsmE